MGDLSQGEEDVAGNPPVLGPDELVGTSSHFGRV